MSGLFPKNPVCSICGEKIEKEERIVISGILSGTGWTSPLGRLDKILDELTKDEGGVWHARCFKEICPECDLFK
jgi:hypothetical protein